VKTLILLSLLTAGWDARMTDQCLNAGWCQEANPILGTHPSDARLYGTVLGTQIFTDTIAWRMRKQHPHVARFTVGLTIVVHGVAITHNLGVR